MTIHDGVERKIVIGMIVSPSYLSKIEKVWDRKYIQSRSALILGEMCLRYFRKYGIAPGLEITSLVDKEKKKKRNAPEIYEEMKTSILISLNEEFERVQNKRFNLNYLMDQTFEYFKSRKVEMLNLQTQELIEQGNSEEAEKLIQTYRSIPSIDNHESVYLGSKESLDMVNEAFEEDDVNLITYSGPFGEMVNRQLIRGGFVAFLAPEKRGKTFMLLDLAIRGLRDHSNVAFIQIGDMSRNQQLRRIAVYLSRLPYFSEDELKRRDNDDVFVPEMDCLLNQNGSCNRQERESDWSMEDYITEWGDVTWDTFQQYYEDGPSEQYKPCRNCNVGKYQEGSVFLRPAEKKTLSKEIATVAIDKFFNSYHKKFKLSTFANGTMDIDKLRSLIYSWEKEDGFVPDVIALDYADLLVSSSKGANNDFRHSVDDVWRGLRGLSQELHCLMLTATQADAAGADTRRLSLSNFSEDKRKYAHVTAMYGLNEDPHGEEAKIGLWRINQLVVREGPYASTNEVYLLQQKAISRPYLGSFRRKHS